MSRSLKVILPVVIVTIICGIVAWYLLATSQHVKRIVKPTYTANIAKTVSPTTKTVTKVVTREVCVSGGEYHVCLKYKIVRSGSSTYLEISLTELSR